MLNDLKLGYLGVESSRRSDWQKFAEVCGLGVGDDSDANTLFLRVDDRHHRIAIHNGPNEGVQYIGWDVGSEPLLAHLLASLEKHGVAVEKGSSQLCAQRRVQQLYSFRDPDGFQSELIFNPQVISKPFQSLAAMDGGFVTGDQGFGHVVFNVPDIKTSSEFYMNVLGFRKTDSVRGTENIEFLRCNPRHHSVGCFEAPGPASFQHLMIQVEELDDVGRAYDRVQQLDSKSIVATLGRHNVERMLSFYLKTPSNFLVEVGWGAVRVDDEKSWSSKTYEPPSLWGHQWLQHPAE